eukprot:COSAG02_NODE_35_length_49339_cov_20.375102_8_plen_89_part_00
MANFVDGLVCGANSMETSYRRGSNSSTLETRGFDEVATGTFSGGTPLPIAAIISPKDLVFAGALGTAHVPMGRSPGSQPLASRSLGSA